MTTYTFTITSAAAFNTDIALIDAGGKDAGGTNNTYNFNITAGFTLDRQLDAINLTNGTASGDVLNISGANASGGVATLNGNNIYNGLFVYDGTVNISDLTIANAVAKGGAGGPGGGGGGAGLGGGLFIAGPNAIAFGSATMTTGGNVTVFDVGFTGDSAVGGAGTTLVHQGNTGAGGGGGLGGAGGNYRDSFTYGGGGGVGLGAYGGFSDHDGGAGIILGAQSGGSTAKHGTGGADGGGGGSGNYNGGSGAGGVGGGAIPPPIDNGGRIYYSGSANAGFGGGGGGAGNGGFGGGGGGGATGFIGQTGYTVGGHGGFGGGGGGGGGNAYSGGGGGFGGGHGGKAAAFAGGTGGGGLGAGGDIFVQQGGHLTIQAGSSLAAGTVTGGAGTATGSGAGAAFGGGLFIQGNQTVTFGSIGGLIEGSASVAGVIADETGSVVPTGDGTGTGAGALAIDNAIVTLSAANTYSGGTTINGGNLELDHADTVSAGKVTSGAAGTGAITFAGTAANPSNLTLENAAQPANGGTYATTLTDFGPNNALLLDGLTYTANSTATYSASTHLLTVTSDGITENFTLNAPTATTFYTHLQALGGTGTRIDTVCFCSGTRIRIARAGVISDVAVERLAIGDLAVTASGEHRPIRWIGHRSIDCRQHPHPDAARPVRIAANAIAPNQPARDLLLSPGHAIRLDVITEVLIPAGALLNGTTIQKVKADHVTYWHIELDSHDVLLAENLPAESYLEMGNRDFFQGNLAAIPDASIDPATHTQADFCRPFHAAGPLVDVVRAQLRARAVAAGWTLDATDPWADLHLVADGVRIDPVCRDLVARLTVPAGTSDVWLISSASRPCEISDSRDDRALGVCIRTLTITDGFSPPAVIDLADPLLSTGFHAPEGEQRWTTGRTHLPSELWTRLDGATANGFFLRVELASPAVPRWIAPTDAPGLLTALPTPRHLALIANNA